jgi:DNA invertase Pin-like site-specific DNA recombinase
MMTIRELRDREIALRSLREGIDTSNDTGRMIAGVLASLAELELELGRETPRSGRRGTPGTGPSHRPTQGARQVQGRARRMHSSGEPVSPIAATLGVSRATVYRVLAEPRSGRRRQI